ncbi:MAG: fumarate hydratase C-terminal domain-containing protein [Clostridia bacterium]|nr:fumarate hydratase C-terminal domain-containing protein [Clostridia bacterium]
MIDVSELKAGQTIYLTGTIYTARDAAHGRLKALLDAGEKSPVDFEGKFIYYAGPTPERPGRPIGAIGPTTSSRMDSFISYMPRLKVAGMIGKGDRSDKVIEACKKYKMVYLLATGGAGALLARCVKSSKVVAFDDLGCEAIRELTVENFPVIVAYDTLGGNIFQRTK